VAPKAYPTIKVVLNHFPELSRSKDGE